MFPTLETELEPTVPDSSEAEEGAAVRRRHARHLEFYIGATLIVIIVLVSVLAPLISPDSPTAENFALRFAPPFTDGHIFGTDSEGRDVLSRLIWGGRTSLLVSFTSTTAAAIIGSALGLIAAFSRETASNLIMRSIDLVLAFPVIMVALSLAEIIGPGLWVIGIAIVFSATPYITRITFGEAKRERNKEYVEAARALGASRREILFREVVPNVSTVIIVYWSSLIGITTVFAASLSALGIGVQPPTPDWGQMINDGAQVLLTGSPWEAILPGLAVLVVGLSFNWLGDGLRDILDPHLQSRA